MSKVCVQYKAKMMDQKALQPIPDKVCYQKKYRYTEPNHYTMKCTWLSCLTWLIRIVWVESVFNWLVTYLWEVV